MLNKIDDDHHHYQDTHVLHVWGSIQDEPASLPSAEPSTMSCDPPGQPITEPDCLFGGEEAQGRGRLFVLSRGFETSFHAFPRLDSRLQHSQDRFTVKPQVTWIQFKNKYVHLNIY